MEIIILIIILSWLSNLLAWGTYPLEKIKEKYDFVEWLFVFINCSKCIGFWLGFIMDIVFFILYQSSYGFAFLVSFIAAIIEKHLKI